MQPLANRRLAMRVRRGEDEDLLVWQVPLQVNNHGADHRAQVLWLLNDLGVKRFGVPHEQHPLQHQREAQI
jgi:hypothetical protein